MSTPRKLEYFEDQLKNSFIGREALFVIRQHAKEVMYLVNNNRPTMVCWQRNQGPRFIKSIVDSGFEEDVQFFREVKGVTLESLILEMAEVLQDNGTPQLKQSIGKYAGPVLNIARNCRSLKEVMEKLKDTELTHNG